MPPKSIEKADRLCKTFFSTPSPPSDSALKCLSPLFQIDATFLHCPPPPHPANFQLISKTPTKHSVDYHPSPSAITLRINPLISHTSPDPLVLYLSPELFLNFLSNRYIYSPNRRHFLKNLLPKQTLY